MVPARCTAIRHRNAAASDRRGGDSPRSTATSASPRQRPEQTPEIDAGAHRRRRIERAVGIDQRDEAATPCDVGEPRRE
ncbi:MAG: hypothetical protein AUG14_00470 [Candidatus Rokubacteria bacterium 13_1_20CM_2_68_19]|nr:MAG: hypothetical protein AUG14_00470 [Candidatus Rokubacteria bacterium 13_1_20CM_2_68_19]